MYLTLYLGLLLFELFRLLCMNSCRFYSPPCIERNCNLGSYICMYIHTHTYVYYREEFYFKKFLCSQLVKGTFPMFAVLICSFVADWNKCEGRGQSG